MINALTICPLSPDDAPTIIRFIEDQPLEYMRFFHAFGADVTKIIRMLEAKREDVYSGLYWRKELIGIFMLRGWDAGYAIPSFGVLIDYGYRGGSLLRLTLDIAKITCRLAGATKLMAKIHPDNVSPRGARRLGLHQTGLEEDTGNIIYHLDL